jgi:hypothetical protein
MDIQQGRTDELLGDGACDKGTVLVLSHFIYFKIILWYNVDIRTTKNDYLEK